ncbi:MAG TPA: metallophosphoesterase [Kofleriaceae bacterium]
MTRTNAGTDLIAPLVLLQLSDLHFGPYSRFSGCNLERLAAHCRQAIEEERRDLDWHETVDLVIVTGDVAEAAHPPEYVDAAVFFKALARELKLLPHRFVFVPGNHDISWTKCRLVELQLEDGVFPPHELRARLDDVKFEHFETFVRDVYGGKARHEVKGAAVTPLLRGAFIHDFADLGVSVAALNSCERESHRKEDHVGAMSDLQAQAVLDYWRKTPTELIRVLAVHHNPAAMATSAIEQWLEFLRSSAAHVPPDVVERIAASFVGFEGRDYLQRLAADAHASLILHGHHHASEAHQAWAWRGRDAGGAGDARIISAGSWGLSLESGKLPKDQPVVMQLIRLDPGAAEMKPVLLRYDPGARLSGDVRLGRFVPDPDTRTSRPIGLSLPPAHQQGPSHKRPRIDNNKTGTLLGQDVFGVVRNLDELRLAYETTVQSKHPCKGASAMDLDWTLIDLYVEKSGERFGNDLSKEGLLDRLGLFSPLSPAGQSELHQAAVLCFCVRPERYSTGSCCVRGWCNRGRIPAYRRLRSSELAGKATRREDQIRNQNHRYIGWGRAASGRAGSADGRGPGGNLECGCSS